MLAVTMSQIYFKLLKCLVHRWEICFLYTHPNLNLWIVKMTKHCDYNSSLNDCDYNSSLNDITIDRSSIISMIIKWKFFRSCVIGHACQNNCFFVLLSWMPTYFHDTFPEVKVIFCYFLDKDL